MSRTRFLGVLVAAVVTTAAVFTVQAQDDAPALVVKPYPAEIMPLAAKSMLLDIVRAGEGLVAVGDRGHILRSTDGNQWTQVNVPVRSGLTAVAFADAKTGCAVGHDAVIVCSADGGQTWQLRNFQPDLEKPFLSLVFVDATTAYAVGAYGLFYGSTDAGKTWSAVEAEAVTADEVHLNGISKLANGYLFIAGESGMLALSVDAGKTWKKLQSPYDSTFFGVLPKGEKGALVYGLRGNVYVTEDAGSGVWKALTTNSVASMFGGVSLPDGASALVGLNGVVLVVAANGSVREFKTSAGTPLSAALAYGDGLLAVGESGVQAVAIR